MIPKAHLVLMIRGHLPYVRHPEAEGSPAESVFFDALNRCYLPLLRKLEGWLRDGLRARLSLCLSPTLAAMMQDEYLCRRFVESTGRLLDSATGEVENDRASGTHQSAKQLDRDRLEFSLIQFEDAYNRDLLGAFREFQECGLLELIAGTATPVFLPLFRHERGFLRGQIRTGIRSYREGFGCDPKGIWLPRSEYFDGLEGILADEGLSYFCLEPADVQGREVPQPSDFLVPSITPGGTKVFGIEGKFSEVCFGSVQHAENDARPSALEDYAAEFVGSRVSQVKSLSQGGEGAPVMLSPFCADASRDWDQEDAEVLDFIVRKSLEEQSSYLLSSPSDVTGSDRSYKHVGASQLRDIQIGDEPWPAEKGDWAWLQLSHAVRVIRQAGQKQIRQDSDQGVLLAQMTRELLLASSSDWSMPSSEYGEHRLKTHLYRFRRLAVMLEDQSLIDPNWVSAVSDVDRIFPAVDPRDFV